MPEALHNTQNDFWRPPAAAQPAQLIPEVSSSMVEACDRCETEFMVGARFCYLCGAVRQVQPGTVLRTSWTRRLEFNYIKQSLGLPVASLVAFLIGLGCVLAALVVGAIYAVQTSADFQAIQFWRMEWLLAAIAFFVAGVLFKGTSPAK